MNNYKIILLVLFVSISFVSCSGHWGMNKVSNIDIKGVVTDSVKVNQAFSDTLYVVKEFAEAAWFAEKRRSGWLETRLANNGKKVILKGNAPDDPGTYPFTLHIRSGSANFSHHTDGPYDITLLFEIEVVE